MQWRLFVRRARVSIAWNDLLAPAFERSVPTKGGDMLRRGIAAAAMLLMVGHGAFAQQKPTIVRRLSCSLVRYYVAKYSEVTAEAWARSHGATDAQIETARHCLAGTTVQTASFGEAPAPNPR